jgi:uncharacterized protein
MPLYLIILICIVIVFLALVIIIRIMLKKAFHHPQIKHSYQPEDFDINSDEIFIKTKNLKQIQVFLTTNQSDKPLIVLLHGWANTSDKFYPLAKELIKKNWQLLFVNARNHGRSDPDSYSTMVKFIEDLDSVLRFVRDKFSGIKIILIGHSLGAATSIYVSGRNPQIKTLVSVSSFTDLGNTMARSFLKKHMPQWIIKYILKYIEKEVGLSIDELSPINNISKVLQPILLLHGTNDKIVPVEECNQLYNKCVNKYSKQCIIEGANHSSILERVDTFKSILDYIENFEN